MEPQYLQRYYGVALSKKDIIKRFDFKCNNNNNNNVNNIENDNDDCIIFNDDFDENYDNINENYDECDFYEQLKELNNKLSEKYKNIKIYKYSEHYFDNDNDKEYYLGIYFNYTKINKSYLLYNLSGSDLLGYLSKRDSMKAINELLFPKKIGDTIELFEVLKKYNINKKPRDLIVTLVWDS